MNSRACWPLPSSKPSNWGSTVGSSRATASSVSSLVAARSSSRSSAVAAIMQGSGSGCSSSSWSSNPLQPTAAHIPFPHKHSGRPQKSQQGRAGLAASMQQPINAAAAALHPRGSHSITSSSSSSSSYARRAVIRASSSNGTSRTSSIGSRQPAASSRQSIYTEGRQQQQPEQQGWQKEPQPQQEQPPYEQQQQYDRQQRQQQGRHAWPSGANSRLLQQRQALALREQQQQQQQQQAYYQQQQQQQQDGVQEDEGLIVPQQRFVLRSYRNFAQPWYQQRQFLDPQALHAAILERCGRGMYESAALLQLVRTACSPRDAQLALSALSAVRSVAVSQGRMAPWPDSFLKAFVKMSALCGAPEVLVSAMQRPNELGLVFKWKTLMVALKHWGDADDVDKLEQVMFVLEDAGIKPDQRMAYVVVRACVNTGQWERIDGLLAWFRDQGVTQFKPAMMSLLNKAAAAKHAAARAEAKSAAAAAAAGTSGYLR